MSPEVLVQWLIKEMKPEPRSLEPNRAGHPKEDISPAVVYFVLIIFPSLSTTTIFTLAPLQLSQKLLL
jgi:hypothetical protein